MCEVNVAMVCAIHKLSSVIFMKLKSRNILVGVLLTLFIFTTAMSFGSSRHCSRLFTVRMGKRAANAVYRGSRHVTLRNLRLLGYIERCQENPSAQVYVRRYDRHLDRTHKEKIYQIHLQRDVSSWLEADASWYNDGGSTACGYHVYYGVANKNLACGTHVTFSYNGRIVGAVVDDRGPYYGDRVWDLNQNTASALGFSGTGFVHYRIG